MSSCKKYKSCKHVPCGGNMNKCRPHYCHLSSNKIETISNSWGYCNMANWKGKNYKKYKSYCKPENNCKFVKTRKNKNIVDAKILHHKMPYIWRFIKPNTRKYMIDLAKKPVKTINIPFTIFPTNNAKNTIKNKKLIKTYMKNMTRSNKKRFLKLRKKYKNI